MLLVVEVVVEVERALAVQLVGSECASHKVAHQPHVLQRLLHNCLVALRRNDLLQRHFVLAEFQRVRLRLLAQQLQQSARNHQLVRGHPAHVHLLLHAVDEAGQRLPVEALLQLPAEVLNFRLPR